MLDHQGQMTITTTTARGLGHISAVISYSLVYDAVDVVDNDNLATALLAKIQISIVLIGTVRKSSIELIVLAKQWGIAPEKAQKTIQATTQRGIRTMLHLSLLRAFRTNVRNLCYCHQAHLEFSDMMFTSTVFRRGKRCAQVYATDFGWDRAFPMASRKTHEILLLLFARDRVLPACICDNAKEMIQGKFCQKLKDAACYLTQLEPYTPCGQMLQKERLRSC